MGGMLKMSKDIYGGESVRKTSSKHSHGEKGLRVFD